MNIVLDDVFFSSVISSDCLQKQCPAFFQYPTGFAVFAQDTSEPHNTCGSAVSVEDLGASSVDVSRASVTTCDNYQKIVCVTLCLSNSFKPRRSTSLRKGDGGKMWKKVTIIDNLQSYSS